MSADSIYALFAVLGGLVVLIWTGCMVAAAVRITAMDRNLERTVLLLTVLANKQGATDEDLRAALGGTVEEAAAGKTESG